MSFDRLAPHYRWMELLLAGGRLQRCRTAFLSELRDVREVLTVGEGNGRFLEALHDAVPEARITVVDASRAMLEQSRQRLLQSRGTHERVTFLHADVLNWTSPPRTFDLIATHFFLDCFSPGEMETVIKALSAPAGPACRWLLADFRIPAAGWSRQRARLIHWSMYRFFRLFTGISAHRLYEPDAYLEGNGFVRCAERITDWGLLRSALWVRGTPGS